MDYHPNLKKLRSYWQFANVCQYFLMFYLAYGLENFETDEFESALIRQDKEMITSFIIKLLKNLHNGRFVNSKTWETILFKEISENDVDLPLPQELPKDFFELTLFQQVVCLQYLTDIQFRDSAEKIRKGSEEEEFSQDWRVKPIGQDVKGNEYFLFDDNRLYLSKPQTRPPKSTNNKAYKAHNSKIKQAIELGESTDFTWEPLCITLEDWEEFSQKFSNSRYEIEKELHETLAIDILPKVIPELKYKIRRQRKLAETIFLEPKRSSRLQVKEALRAQKETEEKHPFQAFPEKFSSPGEIQPKISHRELRSRKRDSISVLSPPLPKESSVDLIKQLDSLLDDEWIFSCICGIGGKNFDDGTQQIACETCGVWEHIKCQKFTTPTGKPLRNFSKIIFFCNRCKLLSQDTEKNPESKDTQPKTNIPDTSTSEQNSQDIICASNPVSAKLEIKNENSDVEASISKLLEDPPNSLTENDGLSSSSSVDSEKEPTEIKQTLEYPEAIKEPTSSELEILTNNVMDHPSKSDVNNISSSIPDTKSDANDISSPIPDTKSDANDISSPIPDTKSDANSISFPIPDTKPDANDIMSLVPDKKSNANDISSSIPDTKTSIDFIENTTLLQNHELDSIPRLIDSEVSRLSSAEQTPEERPDEIVDSTLISNSAISDFSGNFSSNGIRPLESGAETISEEDKPSLRLPSDSKRTRCEPEEPWHDVSPKKTRPSI